MYRLARVHYYYYYYAIACRWGGRNLIILQRIYICSPWNEMKVKLDISVVILIK